MENKKLHLEYKNENGEIYDDLIDGLFDIKEIEGFSAEEFYHTLDKVIRELSPENSFKIIESYPENGPKGLFGFLFYYLKGMDDENKLEKEFDYLKEFIDYKIDIFMIVNYLR